MTAARVLYLWRCLLTRARRRPCRVPAGWERVTPLEDDPDYLDLLIALHDTDTAWYLRMSSAMPRRIGP